MQRSAYFGKQSPSPPRNQGNTGKRKRFIFNSKNDENEDKAPKIPKLSHPPDSKPKNSPPVRQSLLNINSFRQSEQKPKSPPRPKSPTKAKLTPKSINRSPSPTNTTDAKTRLSQFALTKKKQTASPFQAKSDPEQKELKTKVAHIKNQPKYTPLEKQVIQLWKENPGVVLAIEVGYRFLFMGEDAIKASKILHFILTPAKGSSHFPHCSLPAVTLHVHIHRLVNAGLKVGIVSQTETRALKAASSNRNNPFARELSQIYTKGTFISPKIDRVSDEDNTRKSGAADSGFLLCFQECDYEDIHHRRQVMIAFIAVNVCTGQIIWDYFQDEFLRTELENRLASMKPTEMIIPEAKYLSPQSESLIEQYFQQNRLKDSPHEDNETFQYNAIRIERVSVDEKKQIETVRSFYSSEESLSALPDLVVQCVGQMILYLTPFSLQNLFSLTNNFAPFTQDNVVPLDCNVIQQLEIIENVDGHSKQNLFWLIDVTETSFGSRLLRSWLLHPKKDEISINERLDAVEEIIHNKSIKEKLTKLLTGLPDLERGICRLFYHKCEPMEFISIMRSFISIFQNVNTLRVDMECFSSKLLKKTISSIPDLSDVVAGWLSCLSVDAARSGKLYDLFQFSHVSEDPYPSIAESKKNIQNVQEKLNEILAQLRVDTGFPRLQYVTISTDEYLIELSHKNAEKVPNDWLLINKTKAMKRFRTPRIKQQYEVLCQYREILDNEIKASWEDFIEKCKEKYYELRNIVVHVAVLDCLYALSVKGSQSNFIRPLIKTAEREEDAKILIKDGRHPIIESFADNMFVPNDTELEGKKRCIMLTGPNMGGKSCYIKQVALIVLLAQIGSFVPASYAHISPVDRIMVRMGAQDSMEQGKSTFFVEMQESSDILRRASPRSLVIFDELGRGTSTHDGVAIADATLRYLLGTVKCFTLFVTHYHLLCETATQFPEETSNFHMGFFQNGEEGDVLDEFSITFLYKLTAGMASRSFGMNVAKLAGIPSEIVERAISKSSELRGSIDLIDTSSERDIYSTIIKLLHQLETNSTPLEQAYEMLLGIWNVLRLTRV